MDDDFVEVFPTRWELTAAYAICCAKCHETKLAKYFRRPLTRAQAEARGYKGMPNQDELPRHLKGDRLMTVESKYCNKCQPSHYKPSAMTKKEIYNAAYNGLVPNARADADVEKKRTRTSQKIAIATATRWGEWKSAPWAHIKQKLSEELRHIQRALSYHRNHARYKEELGQLSEFLVELRIVLQAVRAQCTINARTQRKVDETLTWCTLIGEDNARRLAAMWEKVPVAARVRWRHTPAPINAAVRHEPLLADYIPPRAPNKRKPEEPIPEERMELINNIMREAQEKRNL